MAHFTGANPNSNANFHSNPISNQNTLEVVEPETERKLSPELELEPEAELEPELEPEYEPELAPEPELEPKPNSNPSPSTRTSSSSTSKTTTRTSFIRAAPFCFSSSYINEFQLHVHWRHGRHGIHGNRRVIKATLLGLVPGLGCAAIATAAEQALGAGAEVEHAPSVDDGIDEAVEVVEQFTEEHRVVDARPVAFAAR